MLRNKQKTCILFAAIWLATFDMAHSMHNWNGPTPEFYTEGDPRAIGSAKTYYGEPLSFGRWPPTSFWQFKWSLDTLEYYIKVPPLLQIKIVATDSNDKPWLLHGTMKTEVCRLRVRNLDQNIFTFCAELVPVGNAYFLDRADIMGSRAVLLRSLSGVIANDVVFTFQYWRQTNGLVTFGQLQGTMTRSKGARSYSISFHEHHSHKFMTRYGEASSSLDNEKTIGQGSQRSD